MRNTHVILILVNIEERGNIFCENEIFTFIFYFFLLYDCIFACITNKVSKSDMFYHLADSQVIRVVVNIMTSKSIPFPLKAIAPTSAPSPTPTIKALVSVHEVDPLVNFASTS